MKSRCLTVLVRRSLRLMAAALLSVVLAGCSKDESTPPPAKPHAPPSTPAAVAEPGVAKQAEPPSLSALPNLTAAPPKIEQSVPPAPKIKYRAGEDPEFARAHGWPVVSPEPLPGALLPQRRIVAYYGNPNSKRMGALGEYPKDEMLQRLKAEAAKWEEADPGLPVQPAGIVANFD